MASTRTRRSSGVRRPVTTSTVCFLNCARSASPTASAVVMKRQKMTGRAFLLPIRSFIWVTSSRSFGSSPKRLARPSALAIRASSSATSSQSIAVAGSTSVSANWPSSWSNRTGSSTASSAMPPSRLRSALSAAAGDEPTQRIRASVPQKASRRARSPSARVATPRQYSSTSSWKAWKSPVSE